MKNETMKWITGVGIALCAWMAVQLYAAETPKADVHLDEMKEAVAHLKSH